LGGLGVLLVLDLIVELGLVFFSVRESFLSSGVLAVEGFFLPSLLL